MIKVFSPNMLKTFEVCPKKFELRYIKNINMPLDDTPFLAGKNVHAMASYYLRGENIEKMEKALSEKEYQLWQNLKSTKFFDYEVVSTEYQLSVKVGKYFFGGRLDALVKGNDIYYILDYKTGMIPKDVTYDYQTMIYLLAVCEFYQTNNVKFVYLDVKNQKETIINLTQELKISYEKKLQEVVNNIESGIYNKTNKIDVCPCEYKLICY